MGALKHLPESLWPPEDRLLFEAAYTEGDVFDDQRGVGVHLSEGSRRSIRFAWRRWLGFLHKCYPRDLLLAAADRITPERVRGYVEVLGADMKPASVATMVAHLYDGARLVAPDRNWLWLKALKTRLQARGRPEDRFDRLTPAYKTLDFGIELMNEALDMPLTGRREREVQFRDGLIISILSLWPIRRRSIAALTVSRHVRIHEDGGEIQLFAEDMKGKRAARWPVPDALLPYLRRYLREIRPRLIRGLDHDAMWPSLRGGALRGNQIYGMVLKRTQEVFGKGMALHDFRRAAATFLAMDSPEKVGLTPGVLQHAGPDVGDRIYNLARITNASRRHVDAVSVLKARLRTRR